MATFVHDLRYAIRQLRKSPGFTAVILVTLGLCIGANLAIFAVVNSVLLRPLPFPQPDRLVLLYNSYPKAGKPRDLSSLTNYYERRGQIPAFSSLSSISDGTAVIGETGSTELVETSHVTPEFFTTLGVRLAMGRAFNESEMTYQTDQEAILTDSYWRQQFGADPNVLGRSVRSDGIDRKIVGVLPPSFSFLSSKARIYMPLSSEDAERNLGARHANHDVEIARLAPGATLGEAQMQVEAHNAAHAGEFKFAKEMAAAGFHSVVVPLHADHVASIRPTVILLQAGAFLLLLIGGVNMVNLLLIRASSRAKEMAVRQSMGAKRRHVIGQAMTETVLLTLLGGVCGLWVGDAGVQLLTVLGADQLPLGANIVFDWRLAEAALAGSIVLGVIAALPIAWFSLRRHLANSLQSESRSGTATASAQRLRYGFIVAQISLAFVLLSGAGLLGLSLERAMAVSPGFQSDHILTGQFTLPWKGYHDPKAFVAFTDRVVESGSHQPGVTAVGGITGVPLSGEHGGDALSAVGYVPAPGESFALHPTYGVFGNYFQAMGIRLLAGRYLGPDDIHRNEKTCVVDEEFARHYWPNGNAVGGQIFSDPRLPDDSNVLTVVGVVATVKQLDLTEKKTPGVVYFPFMLVSGRSYFLVARTSGIAPEALGDTMRRVVRKADPDIPLSDVRSMESRIESSLVVRRSPALLAGLFAGVALLLAAIGTYGVLSFAVSQRRREIGLRMALGALPQQVLSQFQRIGGRVLLIGLVFGIAGALAMGRAMESLLFGVSSAQVGVLVAASIIMLVIVRLACYLPARRAARVDPMAVLRNE